MFKFRSRQQRFHNLRRFRAPSFVDFLSWQALRLFKGRPPDRKSFPLARVDLEFLKNNRQLGAATWIGHATLLVQIAGKNILTDPHFSDRASPVQWAGPKRVVAPAISMSDLPVIDMVILSHNHYDSLDANSIDGLVRREGGTETLFLVPAGLRDWFANRGVTQVIEFDWFDNHETEGLAITAVPVQHWSKRIFSPRDSSLWAGWIVEANGFKFFFAGDSGYTPFFKEIGARFGPFDLAAIPIGAYEPRWFMRFHHLSPEEAVKVHLDVKSKKSIAIHWGTFVLAD
jgi:N-acyl-phosphatidylethanolamine-hydrolysing phospholipase D